MLREARLLHRSHAARCPLDVLGRWPRLPRSALSPCVPTGQAQLGWPTVRGSSPSPKRSLRSRSQRTRPQNIALSCEGPLRPTHGGTECLHAATGQWDLVSLNALFDGVPFTGFLTSSSQGAAIGPTPRVTSAQPTPSHTTRRYAWVSCRAGSSRVTERRRSIPRRLRGWRICREGNGQRRPKEGGLRARVRLATATGAQSRLRWPYLPARCLPTPPLQSSRLPCHTEAAQRQAWRGLWPVMQSLRPRAMSR
jgi:hypothetical protein